MKTLLNESPLRPSTSTYFMTIARAVATRSTCLRNNVGAVLVRNRRILTTGYNGAPSDIPHCLDIGCARKDCPSGTMHELCRAVHAEQNAIIQAALHGISTEASTLYCTHQPCMLCAKMLINAGVIKVIYDNDYPDKEGLSILREAGVEVEKYVFSDIEEEEREILAARRQCRACPNDRCDEESCPEHPLSYDEEAYLPLHPHLLDSRVRVPVIDDSSLRHSHNFTEITNLRVALPGESIKRMWQLQGEKKEPVVVMQMQVKHDNKPISEDTFVDGEGNVPLQHCREVKGCN